VITNTLTDQYYIYVPINFV